MARVKEFEPAVAVDAAMQLFWAQGYDATTPAELVEHLGIARSSLYGTFGSKRSLFLAALRRYVQLESDGLLALLDEPGSPRARVRSAFELVVESSVRDRDRRGCMITNTAVELAGRDEEVRRIVRGVFDRQEAALRQVVLEGQACGEVGGDVDASDLARSLVASLNGIRVLARVDRSRRRLAGLAEMALRTL